MKKIFTLGTVLLALPFQLAAAALTATVVPLYTDQNMPAEVMQQLMRSQDLALDLKYDEAEVQLRAARDRVPEHPLGNVFLLATRLSQLQESIRQGQKRVPDGFFQDVNELIVQAQAQAQAHPESAYPKFYLGAALGCRGLAKLYTGHYLDSYFDGKNGVALVREAVAIEPQLYDAYMGLGQFEYYCGSLGPMLRFFLALHGSEEKGLEMLQTCGEKATYAAWPCRLYRVKLMVSERGDYVGSAKDLSDLIARYPDNYDLVQQVFLCLDHGAREPALVAAAESLVQRLKQGWKLPAYAHVKLEDCERILANAKGPAPIPVHRPGPMEAPR
jgi:tetratricopeptide (TPR) repeat protein